MNGLILLACIFVAVVSVVIGILHRKITRLEILVGMLWGARFPNLPSGEAIEEFEKWIADGKPVQFPSDPRYANHERCVCGKYKSSPGEES